MFFSPLIERGNLLHFSIMMPLPNCFFCRINLPMTCLQESFNDSLYICNRNTLYNIYTVSLCSWILGLLYIRGSNTWNIKHNESCREWRFSIAITCSLCTLISCGGSDYSRVNAGTFICRSLFALIFWASIASTNFSILYSGLPLIEHIASIILSKMTITILQLQSASSVD